MIYGALHVVRNAKFRQRVYGVSHEPRPPRSGRRDTPVTSGAGPLGFQGTCCGARESLPAVDSFPDLGIYHALEIEVMPQPRGPVHASRSGPVFQLAGLPAANSCPDLDSYPDLGIYHAPKIGLMSRPAQRPRTCAQN